MKRIGPKSSTPKVEASKGKIPRRALNMEDHEADENSDSDFMSVSTEASFWSGESSDIFQRQRRAYFQENKKILTDKGMNAAGAAGKPETEQEEPRPGPSRISKSKAQSIYDPPSDSSASTTLRHKERVSSEQQHDNSSVSRGRHLKSVLQPRAKSTPKPTSPAARSPSKSKSPAARSPLQPKSPAARSPLQPKSPAARSPLKPKSAAARSPLQPKSPAARSPSKPTSPAARSPLQPKSPAARSPPKPTSPAARSPSVVGPSTRHQNPSSSSNVSPRPREPPKKPTQKPPSKSQPKSKSPQRKGRLVAETQNVSRKDSKASRKSRARSRSGSPPGKKASLTFVSNKRSREDVTIQHIRHLQKSTNNLIPKVNFQRLVREVAVDITGITDFRFSILSLQALQESAEAYLIGLFEDSYLLTMHANRKTLYVKDMQLAKRIRGN